MRRNDTRRYVLEDIAEQIRDMRLEAGMTQQQFAKRVKLRQPLIALLESGNYGTTTIRTLDHIAAALKLELDVRFIPKRTNKK